MAPFFTADLRSSLARCWTGPYFSSWLAAGDTDDPQIKAYRDNVAKYYRAIRSASSSLNGWSNGALFVKGFQALLASG
jgi:hypothetical protein